jgi:hypothetical protein
MSSIGSGAAAGFIPFLVGATADSTSIIFAFIIPAIALAIAFLLAVRYPVPVTKESTEAEIGL